MNNTMNSLSDGKREHTRQYDIGRFFGDSALVAISSTKGRDRSRLNPKTVGLGFFLSLCACSFLATCTAAADLADMPVGHMKITDGSDGKINVEARCVATVDLISAICAKGGMQVVFKTPCRTYETVWSPGTFKLPKEWLHFYGITCSVKADACRVIPWESESKDYDPGLSDDQLGSLKLPSVTSVAHDSGIKAGGLIVEGQPIPEPYVVNFEMTPEGGAIVTVNGAEVERIPGLAASKPREIHIPVLPPSGQFDKSMDLFDYVALRLYPDLLAKGLDKEKAMAEVVKFLKGQDIVLTIKVDSLTGPRIATKDSKYPTVHGGVFPANYNVETGKLVSLGRPGPDVATSAQILKEMWQADLGRGEHILLRSACRMTLGKPSLQTLSANLKLVSSLTILQSECLLSEAVADRPQARMIAIRLKSGPETMTSLLSNFAGTN